MACFLSYLFDFDLVVTLHCSRKTKVIVTTVGPYAHYGSKLVAACAAAGVHCCDLTGESLWVKDMIEKHHEEAERTGAKIVPSCGFDSIPAVRPELGMSLAAGKSSRQCRDKAV